MQTIPNIKNSTQISIIKSSDSSKLQNLIYLIIKEAKIFYNEEAIQYELEKYSIKYLEEIIKNTDNNIVLVTKYNNEIIGFIIAKIETGIGTLEWMGIKKEFRGNHLGENLLTQVIKEIKNNYKEVHKIICDTRINNIPSINNLIKNGFTIVATMKYHWFKQDYYLYERILK